jgi:hypothetical protein
MRPLQSACVSFVLKVVRHPVLSEGPRDQGSAGISGRSEWDGHRERDGVGRPRVSWAVRPVLAAAWRGVQRAHRLWVAGPREQP